MIDQPTNYNLIFIESPCFLGGSMTSEIDNE